MCYKQGWYQFFSSGWNFQQSTGAEKFSSVRSNETAREREREREREDSSLFPQASGP